MLSICIPHYNFVNLSLFENLYAQCTEAGVLFEILIADDASLPANKGYLEKLNQAEFKVFLLEKNIGRSAIRNFLADKASFSYLLFLDADAKIVSKNFIAKYLINLTDAIVSGGRTYSDKAPGKTHLLHWKYGREVEQNANSQFHSNNFAIPKALYMAIKFDESLKNYGYEDVLFGLKAKKYGCPLKNIENPVLHLQLKTNEEFIADTEQALKNLTQIITTENNLPVKKEVKLASAYQHLKNYKLTSLLSFQNKTIRKLLRKTLLKPAISPLLLISIYKLYYFHALQKN